MPGLQLFYKRMDYNIICSYSVTRCIVSLYVFTSPQGES